MITVISGTNNHNSLTSQVSQQYYNRLVKAGVPSKLLLLDTIDFSFVNAAMFSMRSDAIKELQKVYFDAASGFVFVVPEYNGSFPGIVKLLIDAMEVKSAFNHKVAALAGIATGRAGNLRGLDHLTGILMHMHVTVIPGNVLISRAAHEITADGNFVHESTSKLVDNHLQKMISALSK